MRHAYEVAVRWTGNLGSGTSGYRSYSREHGILTEAWSPIAQGGVLDDSTITQIAEEVGKTPAQVVLRWHIERGDIVLPKSVTPSRMKENFELFDFKLEPSDMHTITALDRGENGRTGPHPNTPRWKVRGSQLFWTVARFLNQDR